MLEHGLIDRLVTAEGVGVGHPAFGVLEQQHAGVGSAIGQRRPATNGSAGTTIEPAVDDAVKDLVKQLVELARRQSFGRSQS